MPVACRSSVNWRCSGTRFAWFLALVRNFLGSWCSLVFPQILNLCQSKTIPISVNISCTGRRVEQGIMSKPAQSTINEISMSLKLVVILPLTSLALEIYPLTDEELFPLVDVRTDGSFVLSWPFLPQTIFEAWWCVCMSINHDIGRFCLAKTQLQELRLLPIGG